MIRKVREWAMAIEHPRVQELFSQIPPYVPEDPNYQVRRRQVGGDFRARGYSQCQEAT